MHRLKHENDLRHACVSTWLNAGVPPVQVAEWAGHSVAVLLTVYAKSIVGQEALALNQIQKKVLREQGSAKLLPLFPRDNRKQPGSPRFLRTQQIK